jgi:hypothetical protein
MSQQKRCGSILRDCPVDTALGFAAGETSLHFCQVLAYIPSVVSTDNDISHKQTTLNNMWTISEAVVVPSTALISHS